MEEVPTGPVGPQEGLSWCTRDLRTRTSDQRYQTVNIFPSRGGATRLYGGLTGVAKVFVCLLRWGDMQILKTTLYLKIACDRS